MEASAGVIRPSDDPQVRLKSRICRRNLNRTNADNPPRWLFASRRSPVRDRLAPLREGPGNAKVLCLRGASRQSEVRVREERERNIRRPSGPDRILGADLRAAF
jgi:hypothetical protein